MNKCQWAKGQVNMVDVRKYGTATQRSSSVSSWQHVKEGFHTAELNLDD